MGSSRYGTVWPAKAVVVTNTNEYGIENVELESLQNNEIEVRLEAAGLCHCDLSLIRARKYGGNNPQSDIPMLLDFHHQGRLDLDRMVSNSYAIDEIHQAFIDMQENVNAKAP